MSAPPYMRLYWGDYFRDAHHLNRAQHGSYLLLLAALWANGGKLPADDATLAQKALCSAQDWAADKGVLLSFFQIARGKLTHRRLSAELAKYESTSGKRKEAGKAGAKVTNENRSTSGAANADQTSGESRHNQNHNQLDDKGSSNSAFTLEGEAVRGKVSRRRPETAIPDGYPDANAITEGQQRLRQAKVNLASATLAERFRNHALQNDRRARDWAAAWRNWVVGTIEREGGKPGSVQAAPEPAAWTGPEPLRARVLSDPQLGAGWSASWLERCTYDADKRTLVAPNIAVRDRIRRDAEQILTWAKVSVEVQP